MKRKVVNHAPEVAIEQGGPNLPSRLGIGVKLIPLCGMRFREGTSSISKDKAFVKTLQPRDRG